MIEHVETPELVEVLRAVIPILDRELASITAELAALEHARISYDRWRSKRAGLLARQEHLRRIRDGASLYREALT